MNSNSVESAGSKFQRVAAAALIANKVTIRKFDAQTDRLKFSDDFPIDNYTVNNAIEGAFRRTPNGMARRPALASARDVARRRPLAVPANMACAQSRAKCVAFSGGEPIRFATVSRRAVAR